MHVNNIFGAIQPIEEIVEILKDYPKVHFHVDGVQGVLKDSVDLSKVDSYSISAHKFHGIKGIGILYLKSRRTVHNITFGGGQEDGLRSGTVNVAAAVSLAKALRLSQERIANAKDNHKELKKLIIDEFSKYEHIVINSPFSNKFVDSIINISLPKIKGEAIVNALNDRGIMVSTTSACSSKTFHLNEALYVRGLSKENIEGSIRVSFSYETTKEEVEKFIEVFIDEYNKKFTASQWEEVLKNILEKSKKMSSLISELLMLARMDKKNQKLNIKNENLNEIIQLVIEVESNYAKEKNIKIIYDEKNDIFADVDKDMLTRVFINLISNAITYGNENGTIKITLDKIENEKENIKFDMDNGCADPCRVLPICL